MTTTDETEAAPATGSHYRIGAVARLTGIPADTLRVWERRHHVVRPLRNANGSRLYDQKDVARLALIKRLVDAGQAIGTVANLSLEQLQGRASEAVAAAPAVGGKPTAIALVGSTLPARLMATFDRQAGDRFLVSGGYSDLAEFEAATHKTPSDALVVEVPVLNDRVFAHLRQILQRTGVRRIALAYGIAHSRTLEQIGALGIVALRYPVDWGELRCLMDTAALPSSADRQELDLLTGMVASPRLFDDRELAALAACNTGVACECPHHLADMVMSLVRLEQYSRECEDQGPEDAALHAYLGAAAAHARTTLETALQRVVQADGIEIDRVGTPPT